MFEPYITFFNKMFRKNIESIDLDAKKLLEYYNWPGNVRELRNVVERAVILESGNTLQVNSLPCEINLKKPRDNNNSGYFFDFPDEGIVLDDLEKQVIMQALEMADSNQTKASKLLGISRDTLRYKQKKHKL